MKKVLVFIAFLAIIAIAISSCTKENPTTQTETTGGAEQITLDEGIKIHPEPMGKK